MRSLVGTQTLVSLLATASIAGCSGSIADPPPDTATIPSNVRLRVREVVSGLSTPVFLSAPPSDARLFILEQPGRIRIVENGQLIATPFLDIAARIAPGHERGLLGLAFHPSFASNGFFYINFTDEDGNTRVERYRVSADRNRADPASAFVIITIAQPFANHNGGMIAFGPDRKLYVGMGDGGSGGDPQGNGQNLGTLLGKMLRLDVDAGSPYVVPTDNPFVGRAGARGETWALGLRNPWRFAFDPPSSRLYIADVGEGRIEEISVAGAAERGVNYGWKVMEGSTCFNAPTCSRDGLRLPIVEYDHSQGCSVTGGYVYRGTIAAIRGHYFYSDYCAGWLRSVRLDSNGVVADQRTWEVGTIEGATSFGIDGRGELYITAANGRVYIIEAES
jgi:glucose/arabinose dehydrogenase